MAGARHHTEQSQATFHERRPTKGGAVRIRIALTTAVAVIVVPVVTFALADSAPAASARTRHEASAVRRLDQHNMQLASFLLSVQQQQSNANAAKLAQFLDTLTKQQEANFLNALNAQKQAAQAAAAARQQAAAAAAAASAHVTAGSSADGSSTATADWACIRWHESRDNYTDGNGGAYQFELGTWRAVTGLPNPAEDYPPAVQDAAALRLFDERGWEPWSTRFVCGL